MTKWKLKEIILVIQIENYLNILKMKKFIIIKIYEIKETNSLIVLKIWKIIFQYENEKNNEISNLKTIENNKRISPFSSNRNKKPIRIFKKVTFKMSKNWKYNLYI